MASENEGDAHDLRIVLLGVSEAGKSSMGNAILGREAFKESRTRESEIQRERVEDRNISIIDTPGFFNTQLTDEELQKQMMKSLDLSDPGPHVFLLIVNLENFEEDERNIVEEIEKIFGAQALKFTMVLFIGREQMSSKEWKEFILSEKIKVLVRKFRDQYHEINNRNEINQSHIKKLLKKIDEFIEQNDGQHYNNKSTKEKKKQEEEKKCGKKEQEKERQDEVLRETFETNSAMEEGATNAVFEPENVRQRKKTTGEEKGMNSLERSLTFSSQEKQKQDKCGKISQEKQQTTGEKHPTQAGVAAAPLTPLLPVALLLDLYHRATKMKEKLKEKFSGSRCLVLTTVSLGFICVLLLIAIILQHNTITEQRDLLNSCKNTVEELNQNINSQRDNYEDLTTEKDQWHYFSKILVMSDLRIMLVGKTGAGKSATGNTILRENVFEENFSSESVTKTCQKHQQKVKGGSISVIDTPGLFDTKISEKQLKDEIEKCVNMSVPGPHVFLLVIRLDVRFTDEEKKTVKWIQENFGEKAADYSIILFTRGDQIDKPIEEFLTENRPIQELVRQCKSRYHVFNNKDKNPSQVNELMDKIVRMVMENGGEYYTNEMYTEALKRQREEEERRRLEKEKKIYEEALERQREEDERRRLEDEKKMYKEGLERQRKENERRRLEDEKKMYKEALERQRKENERLKYMTQAIGLVSVVVGLLAFVVILIRHYNK